MICAVIQVEMCPVEIFRKVTAGAAQSTWPSKQLRFLDAVVPKAKAGKGKTRLSSWTLDYSQHVACSLGLGPNEIIPPDLCGLRAAQTRPHLLRILSADIPRPGDKPAPPQITHYLPPHLPPSVPSLPALRGGVSSTPHVMPSPRCHSKPSHCIVMPFNVSSNLATRLPIPRHEKMYIRLRRRNRLVRLSLCHAEQPITTPTRSSAASTDLFHGGVFPPPLCVRSTPRLFSAALAIPCRALKKNKKN